MKSKGFTVVEAILVIVVVVVLAGVGYLAYTNFIAPKSNDESSKTTEEKTDESTSPSQTEPTKVESDEDLETAVDELDKIPVDDSSADSELEKTTDKF